jgi:DNA-binding LacI/PurR family transcriptional regulator
MSRSRRASDKVPTAAEVRQAILAAAEAKGWVIAPQPDGKLLATLKVRNKHAIVVEISYAADQYFADLQGEHQHELRRT